MTMATPQQRHERNVDHARWRVGFRKSLLTAHQQTPSASNEWALKQREHVTDLERALADLAKLERKIDDVL
jgi:hypothetical protein